MKTTKLFSLCFLSLLALQCYSFAQDEVNPWANRSEIEKIQGIDSFLNVAKGMDASIFGLAGQKVTILAPSDEAFAKLSAEEIENLLKPENKEALVTFVRRHTIVGDVNASMGNGTFLTESLTGETVQFQSTGGAMSVSLNGASIGKDLPIVNTYQTEGMVVHIIDSPSIFENYELNGTPVGANPCEDFPNLPHCKREREENSPQLLETQSE